MSKKKYASVVSPTEQAINQAKTLINVLSECRATAASINLKIELLKFLEAYGTKHNAS